jgi:hypothetical protein
MKENKNFLLLGQAHVQTLLRHSPPFKHDAPQHDDSLGKKRKVSHAFRAHISPAANA